jgi:hypothetical protein
MGLFARMPPPLSAAIVAPVELAHRAWWAFRRAVRPSYYASAEYQALLTAGAFYFVAWKPDAS